MLLNRCSFGCWVLVALVTVCCFVSAPLVAQESFAGKEAGEERGLFCWCPPGKFKMGFAQVDVTLTHGFWLGKYEVTQAQYQFVMGKTPSKFKGAFSPVEMVSWNEVTAFCQKLTQLESEAGRLKGWEYRLPTEAQWEYACRAGTTTVYSFGDNPKLLSEYAWYQSNSDDKTHPVGGKKPNAWGLCDMHGNVFEWCRDWYQKEPPGGSDPEVTKEATSRVVRGGHWRSSTGGCRITSRGGNVPDSRVNLGFRLALVQLTSSK